MSQNLYGTLIVLCMGMLQEKLLPEVHAMTKARFLGSCIYRVTDGCLTVLPKLPSRPPQECPFPPGVGLWPLFTKSRGTQFNALDVELFHSLLRLPLSREEKTGLEVNKEIFQVHLAQPRYLSCRNL